MSTNGPAPDLPIGAAFNAACQAKAERNEDERRFWDAAAIAMLNAIVIHEGTTADEEVGADHSIYVSDAYRSATMADAMLAERRKREGAR